MFRKFLITTALALPIAFGGGTAIAQAPAKKPNILVIMGDDVGWFNIGAYHRGMMSGKTPNLDRLAAQGMSSPTTTPRRVARRVAPTSSPASCRYVQG
jgi:Sulfatase